MVKHLEMRSSSIWELCGLRPKTGMFIGRDESLEKHRGMQKEGSMKAEAEVGLIPSQTKEHLEPSEARKDSAVRARSF